jgi:hypothetical protein
MDGVIPCKLSEAIMKKPGTVLFFAALAVSFACQTLFPATPPPRDGTVISNCADITKAIRAMQSSEIPQGLYETGVKQGNEFDVNEYFSVLPNLSMQEGYALDYVFRVDSLGSFPLLAARPIDLPPYTSSTDLPEGSDFTEYLNFIEVKDSEQGYFEFISLLVMANQFYLVWHANYNDMEIVCDRAALDAITAERNTGDFGMEFDKDQMKQIHAMNAIEPLVKFDGDTAVVKIVTFTKWGGFYRLTYTIDRSFPHEIIDVREENIVPYDCGILF